MLKMAVLPPIPRPSVSTATSGEPRPAREAPQRVPEIPHHRLHPSPSLSPRM